MPSEPLPFELVSASPLPVRAVRWFDSRGRAMVTIVTKVTFTLKQGESPLAEVQDELCEADGYWDDDEHRSLAAATELVPFKRRADVVLVGHARAPGSKRVRSLVVRLVVGAVDKAMGVFCDRAFARDGAVIEGLPFQRMPLRWERAAGGPDTDNPVGVRLDATPDARGLVPLPNLVSPDLHLMTPGDFIAPIHFGPIAPTWPARRRRLHAGLEHWDVRRWNAHPLPLDLDAEVFNIAPLDQQTDGIRPDERIILENLHPQFPRLVTNLVPFTPHLALESAGGHTRELDLECDTLWIDADRGTCALTWRGTLALEETPGVRRVVVRATESEGSGMSTIVAGPRVAVGPALPFVEKATARPSLRFGTPEDTQEVRLDELAPLLPFRAETAPSSERAGAAPRSSPPPPPPHNDDELTLTHTLMPETVVLPPGSGEPFVAPMPEPPASRAPALFDSRPNAYVVEAPAAPLPVSDEPLVAPPLPPPPPWIGPIPVPEPTPAPPAEPPPAEPVAPPPPPAEPPTPLPLASHPLERCAAIAASIARAPEDERPILERHGLTQEQWTPLHAHWLATIDAEVDRGRSKLLTAYDKAYVASLEAERGPLTPQEMARLQLAAERGKAVPKLVEMGLPGSAMTRIRRVWLGRVAKSDTLGAEYRAALRAELEG